MKTFNRFGVSMERKFSRSHTELYTFIYDIIVITAYNLHSSERASQKQRNFSEFRCKWLTADLIRWDFQEPVRNKYYELKMAVINRYCTENGQSTKVEVPKKAIYPVISEFDFLWSDCSIFFTSIVSNMEFLRWLNAFCSSWVIEERRSNASEETTFSPAAII